LRTNKSAYARVPGAIRFLNYIIPLADVKSRKIVYTSEA